MEQAVHKTGFREKRGIDPQSPTGDPQLVGLPETAQAFAAKGFSKLSRAARILIYYYY
jgi:hypothetical protein